MVGLTSILPVELRAHTAFSFNDGAVAPEALVVRAASLGYDAIGITDTSDLGGVVRAKLEADRQGIRLIVGAELVVDGAPLALIARDAEGCRNLAALITESRVGLLHEWPAPSKEAAYEMTHRPRRARGTPRLAWAQVAARASGLHLLTGPASGHVAALVRDGACDEAARTLHAWRECFEGRIAVEVQLHETGGDDAALAGALVDLAEANGVPWVAANDSRYLDADGRLVHDILVAQRAGLTLDDALARGLLHPNGTWRLRTPDDLRALWRGREDGLETSARIAAECGDFSMRWLRPPLPAFPVEQGWDTDGWLREQVYVGAHERWGDTLSDKQCAQLEHELGVIRRLGFAGFFLVMWDAVRFARRCNILCQGRGSAANSAVAYCLGVTAVDPVRHGLLFERFLSEVRVPGADSDDYSEAPDIDVDIEHDRREEVLDYVYGSYRREHAAITCTVQHYRAPNAALDAMRALGYPPEMGFALSKRLHRFDPEDGATAVRETLGKKFGLDVDSIRGRALLTAMRAMDGLPRMRSTHVGGFVLSSAPLGHYLPVEHTAMGRTIIQFDKDDLDAIGVPKFDFLGLGALACVRHAFDAIEKRTGTRPELYGVPSDDAETFEMIARGDTVGTFQIESRAQIASVLTTRPERLYDIVVQVALIRPGPIQGEFVHPYTRRRRGREVVRYAHPLLQPILERTCGIPIFQEQAMAISSALGGFTPAEADRLRRTMGNIRKKGRLETVLAELVERMVTNERVEPRVEREVADQIARDLLTFANYGFPESHAWSFALIAFATAWLKRHHPTEFFLGLLNAQPMGFYPTSTLIHDARRHGVDVRPPCLRDGRWLCTTEETDDPARPALRIGWRHVRGVGSRTGERLQIAHRMAPFTSIEDVVQRVELTRAESLQMSRAAAFSAWEPDRRRAAWEALRAVSDDLPLAPARRVEYAPRALSERELLFMDYLATGICVSGHPMQYVRDRLRAGGAAASCDLESLRDGARIVVAGLVTVRQRPASAKGTIFVLLEDEWGFINVIVNATVAAEYAEVVKFAPFIVVEGKFERTGAVMNVVARRLRELDGGRLAHSSHDFR